MCETSFTPPTHSIDPTIVVGNLGTVHSFLASGRPPLHSLPWRSRGLPRSHALTRPLGRPAPTPHSGQRDTNPTTDAHRLTQTPSRAKPRDHADWQPVGATHHSPTPQKPVVRRPNLPLPPDPTYSWPQMRMLARMVAFSLIFRLTWPIRMFIIHLIQYAYYATANSTTMMRRGE